MSTRLPKSTSNTTLRYLVRLSQYLLRPRLDTFITRGLQLQSQPNGTNAWSRLQACSQMQPEQLHTPMQASQETP